MLKRSHLVVVGTWYYLLCTHCNETLPLLSALQHLEYITEVSPWCKFCKNLRQPFVSCSYMSSQLVVSVQCPQPTTSIRSVSIMNVGMNAWRCVPFVRWVNNDVRARRWKRCGGRGGGTQSPQPTSCTQGPWLSLAATTATENHDYTVYSISWSQHNTSRLQSHRRQGAVSSSNMYTWACKGGIHNAYPSRSVKDGRIPVDRGFRCYRIWGQNWRPMIYSLYDTHHH